MKKINVLAVLLLAGMTLSAGIHKSTGDEKFSVSSGTIFVNEKSEKAIWSEADRLAAILEEITGQNFSVKPGNGNDAGIYLGKVGDFAGKEPKLEFENNTLEGSQGYQITATSDKLWLIGGSGVGAKYAVSGALAKLGYRFYAPTSNWEIIPKLGKIEFEGTIIEAPDYFVRFIWPGWGCFPEMQANSAKWYAANRDYALPTIFQHTYEEIIARNKVEFDKHPEYFAMVNGKRTPSKFCVANKDLRKLISDDAVNYFKANPNLFAISREPSDGANWCECPDCAKLGSISDRALILANDSAVALRAAGINNKVVGLLAYNLHSPPPSIDVDKDVIISVCNGFISGGLTFKEIVDGWQKKKATLGIYEYFSIYISNLDMPGSGMHSNIELLKASVSDNYKKNVRYFSGESSDAWGCATLGQYMTEQMLWDVNAANHTDAMEKEFLALCFGKCADEMQNFYKLINHNRPLLTEDTIAKMYTYLLAAKKVAGGDEKILARLGDIAAYTRYCEIAFLMGRKEASADEFVKFAASIRDRRMMHSYALFRGGYFRTTNPIDFKNAEQVNDDTIWAYAEASVGKYKMLDFEAVSFSKEIVPCKRFSKRIVRGDFTREEQYSNEYYIWIDKDQTEIILNVTGGRVYQHLGNVEVYLYKLGEVGAENELKTLVIKDTSIPPDKTERQIKIKTRGQGLYWLNIEHHAAQPLFRWNADIKVTLLVKTGVILRGEYYFYVPKGTKTLGFYTTAREGGIYDDNEKRIFGFTPKLANGYANIPLNASQTGKIFKAVVYGELNLMTVPPYVSKSPNSLLLPREVVDKDSL